MPKVRTVRNHRCEKLSPQLQVWRATAALPCCETISRAALGKRSGRKSHGRKCKGKVVPVPNKALRHGGVWRSGCIDPRFLDLGTSFR
jgi:hypothetical protein